MSPTPLLTDFPRLIKEAAETFRSECAAWTQFRWEGNDLKAQNPEGLLFYNNAASNFAIRDHDFDYVKYSVGPWITVALTFYEADDRIPIARFLARVDIRKYPIPGATTARGRGKWSKFPAATAQTTAVRAEGKDRLYLQFPALRKYVYFQTASTVPVEDALHEKPGVVIFKDYAMLKDIVNGKAVVADYSDDRIVLHPDGDKKTVVALFIPNDPIPMGRMPSKGPTTTWKEFNPDEAFNPKALEAV